MLIRTILTPLIAILFIPTSAQSLNEQIYSCFISGNMEEWSRVMTEMEGVWESTHSIEMLYDLTVAQYGYTAYSLSIDKKEMAKKIVLKAEENAKYMISKNPEWARAHALMGAIYGFKVGMEPYRVFKFAHRAFDENKLAFELDPHDPQIWMERGNIDLYKPSIFGGDKSEAIVYFTKAIELYEKDTAQLMKNWLYLNTLNGLASSYRKTGRIRKADETYVKLLHVEPNFVWIRDEEYPKFRKKYEGEL